MATRCQVVPQGAVRGRCNTMRRTERSTHTATLSSRSRSVATCARAQSVPWACCRKACSRTYAAAVSNTRN